MSKHKNNPDKKPNKLLHESSPYLLQHAYNPVYWYPWGEEALAKAKNEDKPIIVSIGYSACHWCHVMERECFEKEALAALMNEYFVNIKVDREERPDIDHIYMDAVQAMGLQGGWPLNVFLTPDAKPFYGGTYFPPANWEHLLKQIHKAFAESREEIENSAESFKNSLNRSDIEKYGLIQAEKIFKKEDLDQMYQVMAPNFDRRMGGMEKAPKFPMPSIYFFLLRYYHESKNEDALRHVKLTLDKMAFGGIYDQIGGGFARYSTDMEWFAPHFEKMLYDNGQLVSLYAEAYSLTKETRYKEIVYGTVDWLEKEMTNPEGGFYSALDADSEGEEGKFYVWEKAELESILKEELALFCDYYQVTKKGNWEHGKNILTKLISDEAFVLKHKLDSNQFEEMVKKWKELLYEERSKKIPPGLDDKVLTSWNGLMLKGLADAYRVFNEEKFLILAIRNASFIKEKMKAGEMLYHNYKNGKASIDGYLEDYAFVIQAYISLYEATFDEQWLEEAISLTNYAVAHFFDEKEEMFFFTADNSEKLIARKKEIFDNVIPGSNSVMAQNLYWLGIVLYKEDWKHLSETMLARTKRIILTEPSYLSNWACLYTQQVSPTAEIAITGKESIRYRKEIDSGYYPNKVLAGTIENSSVPLLESRKATDGKTLIYVCYNKTCQMPVDNVRVAMEIINQGR